MSIAMTAQSAAVAATSFLRIASCSYEGSLFGWNMQENVEESSLDLSLQFAFSLNSGCMRAIAVSKSGRYMAVAGADERIKIFNMIENKGLGELTNHSGGITSLEFFEDSMLLSASDDNTLCIWRVHDWQCLHILGGHKDRVTQFSIHPTGKLALSVSKDGTMKLWNLVQGRCSFTRRLKKPADDVKWAADGAQYLLHSEKEVQVFNAADNVCTATISSKSRINRCSFVNITGTTADACKHIALVCEDRSLQIYDAATGNICGFLNLTSLGGGRPRDLWTCCPNSAAITNPDMQAVLNISDGKKNGNSNSDCIVVATSLGAVYVFDAQSIVNQTKNEAAEGVAKVTAQRDITHRSKVDDINGVNTEPTVAQMLLLSEAQLTAEPRFTAVVAWKPTVIAAKAHKRSHKHGGAAENESAAGDDNDDEDGSDVERAAIAAARASAKKAKKLARKRAADAATEEEEGGKEDQQEKSSTSISSAKKSKKAKKAVLFADETTAVSIEDKSEKKDSSRSNSFKVKNNKKKDKR